MRSIYEKLQEDATNMLGHVFDLAPSEQLWAIATLIEIASFSELYGFDLSAYPPTSYLYREVFLERTWRLLQFLKIHVATNLPAPYIFSEAQFEDKEYDNPLSESEYARAKNYLHSIAESIAIAPHPPSFDAPRESWGLYDDELFLLLPKELQKQLKEVTTSCEWRVAKFKKYKL